MGDAMINGARIVLETLHRMGVTDFFGYPAVPLSRFTMRSINTRAEPLFCPPRTRGGT